MAAGICSARIIASCPAPLTMRCGSHPAVRIACSISLTRNESIATAAWLSRTLWITDNPRRLAISSDAADEIVNRAGASLIESVTDIERQSSFAGNHVGGAGLCLYFAHRGDKSRNL